MSPCTVTSTLRCSMMCNKYLLRPRHANHDELTICTIDAPGTDVLLIASNDEFQPLLLESAASRLDAYTIHCTYSDPGTTKKLIYIEE